MRKVMVLLLALLFVIPLVAGCGQNQQPQDDKKPIVVRQEVPVADVVDDKEAPELEETQKTAPAVQKAQDQYKAVGTSSVIGSDVAILPSESNKAEAPAIAAEVPKAAAPKYSEEIIAANFDSGEKPNNLGGNFGAWNKDPSDPTQWCKESFDNVTRHGDTGFAMKLDYSVDSPNPAYNGFWMMLPNFDATKYDALNLWVKGDSKAGYTTVFKIELKGANKQMGRYYISNVGDQWQEISIPLSEFKGLIDRSSLTEFVIVFEDRMASNKKGVLYMDDIRFVKK